MRPFGAACCAGLCALFAVAGFVHAEPGDAIVAGTSLVGELVQELNASPVAIQSLLPPNLCPGHYDMRPGDIEAVADCRLLILQPWQRTMPNVAGVIKAAGIPDARIKVVPVPGNWMVPAVRAEAARAVGALLATEYPERKTEITAAAETLASECLAVGERAKAELAAAGATAVKVVCNEQQADFARWAGLDVVQSYGRPEGLSVAQVDELTRRAKESGAALIVDNMQSGDAKMGETLARNAGAVHVVLSSFPGAEPDPETWEKTLRMNVEKLIAGIGQWRSRHG